MADINYDLLYRILTRCREIRDEPEMKANIVRIYDNKLKTESDAYIAAYTAFNRAVAADRKESDEAKRALADLDQTYKEARAEVLAWVPTEELPETLKALRTDTDKVNAIEALLDVIDEHVKEDWAKELLASEFGTKAAAAVKEINEAIAADKALAEARLARAAAHGPAYEAHLPFKRVVREALGPASRQYQRIHIRAWSSHAADEPSGAEAPAAERAIPAPSGDPKKSDV